MSGLPSDVPGESLTKHLRAAIRQNRARRADYRRRGGLRAWALSVVLVAHERALLPFAWGLDRRARRFWREGIPVLRGDLRPMAASPPAGRVLVGVGPMPWDLLQLAAGLVWTVIRSVDASLPRRWLSAPGFEAAARELASALSFVEAGEQAGEVRLALTTHVLESACVSAANAVGYADRSDGRTLRLSRRFVLGQMLLLPGALVLDALAGRVHARGVPLFVDDIPPVPIPDALHALPDGY